MIRSYKYKLRPNVKFRAALESTLGQCRDLYNAALHQRREAYKAAGKSLSWIEQSRELTEARQIPEVGEVLRSFQTQVLKKLDRAYKAFFRRGGFPRFKSFDRYNSFTTEDAREFRLEGDKLHVQKLGSVRLRLSRPLGGKAKKLVIKREHDGWYAVFSCEVEMEPLPATGLRVGVDVGLESFATLSTSEQIENPRFYRESEGGLAKAQRVLARKKRGSLSRKRAKRIVQGWHAKIQRQRDWFHHQLARRLVKEFDVIVVEDLNVKGLARTRMAKSVLDAGWQGFIMKLNSKAEGAARLLVRVNPRGTSQTCSGCGGVKKKELSERWHSCACGAELHRDHNAALNILARAAPVSLVGQTNLCAEARA